MNFSRQNISTLQRELQAVLDKFAKEKGIASISMGTIRFDSVSARCKIEMMGEARTPSVWDPTPKQEIKVGDKFYQGRTTYTVSSINKPGKYSIGVVTERGKMYKVKPEQLLSMQKLPSVL